jgi:putative ABC transport system ATP-binding protein
MTRLRGKTFAEASPEDRLAIIRLSFLYIEPQHRFGVLDDALMHKIVEAREIFHQGIPAHLEALFERYDPDLYLASGSLLDNIVFGKVNLRFNDAERQVRAIITELVSAQPDLIAQIFEAGLEYNLGGSGRRLTLAQRQKLNLARALLRKSDYYIFNRPLSGLDPGQQEQILMRTLEFLKAEADDPAVVWVLSSRSFAQHFDRLVLFRDHTILDEESLETLPESGAISNNVVGLS